MKTKFKPLAKLHEATEDCSQIIKDLKVIIERDQDPYSGHHFVKAGDVGIAHLKKAISNIIAQYEKNSKYQVSRDFHTSREWS